MSRSMNWDKLRRQRGGAKVDLPVVGDREEPVEDSAESREDEPFVPRNQRDAVRDEHGRLVNPRDWQDEARTLPGQPGNPFTETESGT